MLKPIKTQDECYIALERVYKLMQKNMSEKDLAVVLGYRSRKSEILSGKRKLSLSMIRKLNEELNIPAASLIQAY